MSIFDKLAEERFEIPFSTRAAHFHLLMQPFGIPEEPVFTKEAKAGMLKIAVIMDQAEGQDEAIQQMQRQALVDPQVQQALDYQQLMAEREDAVGQLQQMNQQLVETETRAQEAEQRAMQAEMSAQNQGAQMQQIQGQLEQEQQGRQQATQMAVQARDQSLQEQIGLQEQKQNIAMQAEAFQQQANTLSQQLRQTAAQPTAPSLGPAEEPGAQVAEAANQGEIPPVATEEAAQEQQEAANAQQEAAIQGQQARQATEEDLAKQEAAAQQGGGMTPEEQQMMQEQEAAAQQQAAMQEQQMMEQQAMAEQAMAGVGQEKQSSINVDLLFKKAALMNVGAGRNFTGPKDLNDISPEQWKSAYSSPGVLQAKKALLRANPGMSEWDVNTHPSVDKAVYDAAFRAYDNRMKTAAMRKAAAYPEVVQRAVRPVDQEQVRADEIRGHRNLGGVLGGMGGGLLGGAALAGVSQNPAAMLGGAAAGALGGGLLGHRLAKGPAERSVARVPDETYQAMADAEIAERLYDSGQISRRDLQNVYDETGPSLLAGGASVRSAEDYDNLRSIGLQSSDQDPFPYQKTAAKLSPEAKGAIIGAAIGALGGVASGAVPGAMTGKSDSPGAPAGGALRGGARGAMAGAVSGATGGALLGNVIGKGNVGKQLGKTIGGGALVLGAPAAGALAGLGGARSQDYRVKQAAMEKVASELAPKSLSLANPSKRITSRMTNARDVGKPTGKPGNIGQLTESAFMPKTSAEKCSELGKCSACGKMAKLSEMGKCGVCGAKEKTAAGIMVTPKGSRRLTEQEEAALLMNAEKLPREIITGVQGSLAGAMKGLTPKTAGEKSRAALEFAKRKSIGAGVGGIAGAGVGAAEVGKHRLEAGKESTEQPSDKELKAEGKLHAAKLKAQRSPSYGNKINVARLQLKRDVEKASRENPGGHVGRRAAEGALVGVLAEGGGRGLVEKAKAVVKG